MFATNGTALDAGMLHSVLPFIFAAASNASPGAANCGSCLYLSICCLAYPALADPPPPPDACEPPLVGLSSPPQAATPVRAAITSAAASVRAALTSGPTAGRSQPGTHRRSPSRATEACPP